MVVIIFTVVLGAAVAALGIGIGVQWSRRELRRFAADLAAAAAGGRAVDVARAPAYARGLVQQVEALRSAADSARAAASDAQATATDENGRAEQIARELEPGIAALRRAAEAARDGGDPQVRAAFDTISRDLAQLDDALKGVLAVAASAATPGASADLCSAVRAVVRDVPIVAAANVHVTLDARPCPVPGTVEVIDRMVTAFLQWALLTGGDRPNVHVVVARMPRQRLEEPSVRRQTDPGLTIIPRRGNPRLDRWLRQPTLPAEVVKLVVADSGKGIPADVERMLYDPTVGGSIGLTTARRAIEQARGTVWVQQAREGGAAFHVVLPLAAGGLEPRNRKALPATN